MTKEIDKSKNLKKIKFSYGPKNQHWVGDGFHVHNMFQPTPDTYYHTSPFILLDYAPAKEFTPTTHKRGVGEHPHRGFETVTFALNGEIEHRDSAGGGGTIKTGDVQWMTASSGLVHEEFHSTEFSKKGGLLEMVQLWVNLPKKFKMIEPRYQGVKESQFPVVTPSDAVKVKVIAGEYENKKGACATFSPVNVYQLDFKDQYDFKLNFQEGSNTLFLVLGGELEIENKQFKHKDLIAFDRPGEEISFQASKDSRVLVLNGEPIDEPIAAHGPFVMNTQQEIYQAIKDFQEGKMGRL